MRLAALMGLHVIYVFTHDSIALGEDGPTHEPVEQLLGLRSIPNMLVIRPADANETAVAVANKTIPANSAALKDPSVQALPSLAGFGASANNGTPMANTPFANAQWGPVGDAVGAVWGGTQTPDAALAAAQKAIEDAVAQMK